MATLGYSIAVIPSTAIKTLSNMHKSTGHISVLKYDVVNYHSDVGVHMTSHITLMSLLRPRVCEENTKQDMNRKINCEFLGFHMGVDDLRVLLR